MKISKERKRIRSMWCEKKNHTYKCTIIVKTEGESIGIVNFKFKDEKEAKERAHQLYVLMNQYNANAGYKMIDIYVSHEGICIYNSEWEDE